MLKRLIKGIGLVNCIYVNPHTQQYWVIDYRIYDKAIDGKTKLDHLEDMLRHTDREYKQLVFKTVLMDSWYATKDIMLTIDGLGKIFYCPLKRSRDDSKGQRAYTSVSALQWTEAEQENGKLIKINKFPKDYKSTVSGCGECSPTDWVVTNTPLKQIVMTYNSCAIRWKIEQFHREINN